MSARPAASVLGLDLTAGSWESRLERGPKPMPSVALTLREVRGKVRLTLPRKPVEWHETNAAFLARARATGALVLGIDGPSATNGLALARDGSGWDLRARGGTRAAELELARAGVGLFWTTHRTVARFEGAARWMARSLRLFAQAELSLPGTTCIETYPHGAFTLLRRASAPGPLARKDTPLGRRQRLELLTRFLGPFDDALLYDHDTVDAACAALVAAFHHAGAVRSFGLTEQGGLIWMPDVARMDRLQRPPRPVARSRAPARPSAAPKGGTRAVPMVFARP